MQTESHNTSGVAVGAGYLWLGANGGVSGRRPPRPTDKPFGEVIQADLKTGKTVKIHQLPWGGGVHGITFVPQTQTLWVTALEHQRGGGDGSEGLSHAAHAPARKATGRMGSTGTTARSGSSFAGDHLVQKIDPESGKVLEIINISPTSRSGSARHVHPRRLHVLLRCRPDRARSWQRAGAGVPVQDLMRCPRRRLVLLCLPIVATMVVVGWMRASALQNDDLDVLKVIPENYKLVIDNPFVRVLEARIPAGTEEKPHRHLRGVSVCMTDTRSSRASCPTASGRATRANWAPSTGARRACTRFATSGRR